MNRFRTLVILVLVTALGGCVPDGLTEYDFKQHQPPSTLPEDPGNVLIEEREASGVRVALYIDKGAHTGYNRLRVRLVEAGSETVIEEALVQFTPRYTVDGQEQTVLFENPPSTQANGDDFFEGSAFFLPPRPDAGTFSLEVAFDASGGRTGTLAFALTVEESLWMQRIETQDARYYLSWVRPERPTVGENAFEVALHRETSSGYVPVPGATLDLYPYMDMGGGDGHSTPYEAPVEISQGRYRGKVDFIMAGGWDMTVYVNRSTAAPDTVLFADYTVF